MRATPPLAVLVAAVMAAGCSSGGGVAVVGTSRASTPPSSSSPASSPSTPSPPSTGPAPGAGGNLPLPATSAPARPLQWRSCGRPFQCATLTVPLVYDDPARATINLFLERLPASRPADRIGSLLVNPGGPGVAATTLVKEAADAFSPTLRQRFDIVSWDPRGTGQSDPVRCVDNLDPYLAIDPTPDTPAEKQALIDAGRTFAARCEASNGAILPYISTQDTARDMEQIRLALGEAKVTYFGFSYGSTLGATYATLFPRSVRAMVLDGAPDPNEGREAEAIAQTEALERALDNLLADCAASADCPFRNGGDPGGALDALLARIDQAPLRVGNRSVGQGIAYTAIVSALYRREDWKVLTTALALAQQDDGRLLLAMYDAYVGRAADGTYSSEFDALIAINCLDDPGPTDLGYSDRLAVELAAVAPRLGRASAYGYFCSFWPARATPIRLTGAGAGPIVVVGTTGDPITPLASSRKLAADLQQGRLVTVTADQHTGYQANDCITRTVDNFLTDQIVPPVGLVCG